MKAFLNALKSDGRFQLKQGFYTIYAVVAVLYIIILRWLPLSWRLEVMPFVLFTDPSVLGLFFIGGILLLEKQQGIVDLVHVTPLKTSHYLYAKLLSLAALGLFVSLVITAAVGASVTYSPLVLGIVTTSILFTALGVFIVTRATSLNAFFMYMIPVTLVAMTPCFLIYSPYDSFWLNLLPSVAGFRLVYGAFHGIQWGESLFCTLWLVGIDLLLVHKMVRVYLAKMVYGE